MPVFTLKLYTHPCTPSQTQPPVFRLSPITAHITSSRDKTRKPFTKGCTRQTRQQEVALSHDFAANLISTDVGSSGVMKCNLRFHCTVLVAQRMKEKTKERRRNGGSSVLRLRCCVLTLSLDIVLKTRTVLEYPCLCSDLEATKDSQGVCLMRLLVFP